MDGRALLLTLGLLAAWRPAVPARGADDEALVERLVAAQGEDWGRALQEAFDALVAHGAAHEHEAAVALARHLRDDAARRGEAYLRTRVWASSTLGLAQTRAGMHDAAEETVGEEIERLRAELLRLTRALEETPDADRAAYREALRRDLVGLYDRRALARIGAGRRAAARADLGAALAGGSRDAVLVLGRMELREGRSARARSLFGSLLDEAGGEAWARRGWALTMLPAAPR